MSLSWHLCSEWCLASIGMHGVGDVEYMRIMCWSRREREKSQSVLSKQLLSCGTTLITQWRHMHFGYECSTAAYMAHSGKSEYLSFSFLPISDVMGLILFHTWTLHPYDTTSWPRQPPQW